MRSDYELTNVAFAFIMRFIHLSYIHTFRCDSYICCYITGLLFSGNLLYLLYTVTRQNASTSPDAFLPDTYKRSYSNNIPCLIFNSLINDNVYNFIGFRTLVENKQKNKQTNKHKAYWRLTQRCLKRSYG